MLSDLELAQQLKNLLTKSAANKVASSTITTQIISGTAQSNSTDSSDGKTVSVLLDAAVVVGDDQDQAITLPTNVSVETGDTVQVTCTVQGSSVTSMIVTGVTGRGTEVATTASEAKATADAAADTAATTAQHFWADDSGAHISSTGDHDTSGFHQLMTSVKNAFMHGTTELMTISENLIELGKNSSTAIIKFCAGNGSIGITSSKELYLSGTDGAYLARKTDIDNGNDYGIGLVDDNGSSEAIIEAHEYQVAGTILTRAQMKTAIQPVVSRAAGVITQYGNGVAHYTKIGTWSGTSYTGTLRLRVMTGDGHDGNATQNSWIDIFVKAAWQPNGTTNAFGVSYELHNANSAMLTPYVVATASDSCDIWVKNSWYDESGWYIAEYGGPNGAGVWSDGGSVHQTSVPSATLQSASCLGAIQPVVVLYNGGADLTYDTAPGSGTNGDVTLSETAANFSKLKIFFRTDDNAYGSYEVPFPNGKRVGLSADWSTGTSMWYKARAIDISGTSITTVEYGNVNSGGSSFSHTNVIYIVRIEGIR